MRGAGGGAEGAGEGPEDAGGKPEGARGGRGVAGGRPEGAGGEPKEAGGEPEGTWGGVSGKRRAANGKRQTGNRKSWSLISDKFQQFATMLFSQWPLAYTKHRNTEICKKAEDFRKSSIFTSVNRFFIFSSDKDK